MADENKLPTSSLKDIFIEQYLIKETIGAGGFGHVKLAHHSLTDTKVAVKELVKLGQHCSHLVENEVDIVKSLHHPHVIRLYQVIEKEDKVYLVMELAAKGDLLQRIQNSHRLFEDEARRLFKQIVSAVHYFHQNGIAHRDLKPNNILLDAKGNAKVSDFGLSIKFTKGQLLKDICGALIFRAPEVFLCQGYDSFQVDIWSLGILLYFMISGKFPFEGRDFAQVKVLVLKGRYLVPFYLSAKGQRVISQLLTVDPKQRPNIVQIMENPWLNQGQKCSPHPAEPLPNNLNPIIVVVMRVMGYRLFEIRQSIQDRTFNEVMGTYLLIEEHLKQNASCVEVETVRPTVPPCPTPADLSTFSVPPQRRASLPTLFSTFTLSSEFHMHYDGKWSPPKRGLRATRPDIPLCFPQENPSPSITPHYDSVVSLSCSFFLSSNERCQSEENTLLPGQLQDETIDSSPNKRWSWRRVANRIATTLQRICCCVRTQK
ncbi:sperm motility kinase Z-like [Perognathus longimembris pacificus]|uniref:sperm motility kinase Z-like n=1 Tax=Perognathus longimembris pacificus TaxID=214514 RepID=UPI0020190F64|nr:sperm motility kinase Z-like [Perognathus longimembris pacificus]